MNPIRKIFLFLFAISIFLFNSCENVTDPADECEKTKWQEVKEPTINLIAAVGVNQNFGPGHTPFNLDTANYMEFDGSIQKYYCNGTPSGKFDFTTTFFPDTSFYLYEVLLGQAYQFKFQNDQDHLRVNIKLKAYFNHGLTFESQTLVKDFYFRDIMYDTYWLSDVAIFYCGNPVWIKVP